VWKQSAVCEPASEVAGKAGKCVHARRFIVEKGSWVVNVKPVQMLSGGVSSEAVTPE
jgi:hypothetical protein